MGSTSLRLGEEEKGQLACLRCVCVHVWLGLCMCVCVYVCVFVLLQVHVQSRSSLTKGKVHVFLLEGFFHMLIPSWAL